MANMRLEEKIAQKLITGGLTLSVAESCTGGLLTHRLTNVPGSSKYLFAGLVVYGNAAKMAFAGVPQASLKKHGAVSLETALALAKGVRRRCKTDFGIGVTGIAGPGGGTKNKPVGLTFIAVASSEEAVCLECRFSGTRESIKRQASTQALKLFGEFLD